MFPKVWLRDFQGERYQRRGRSKENFSHKKIRITEATLPFKTKKCTYGSCTVPNLQLPRVAETFSSISRIVRTVALNGVFLHRSAKPWKTVTSIRVLGPVNIELNVARIRCSYPRKSNVSDLRKYSYRSSCSNFFALAPTILYLSLFDERRLYSAKNISYSNISRTWTLLSHRFCAVSPFPRFFSTVPILARYSANKEEPDRIRGIFPASNFLRRAIAFTFSTVRLTGSQRPMTIRCR